MLKDLYLAVVNVAITNFCGRIKNTLYKKQRLQIICEMTFMKVSFYVICFLCWSI